MLLPPRNLARPRIFSTSGVLASLLFVWIFASASATVAGAENFPPAVRTLNGRVTGAFIYSNTESSTSSLSSGSSTFRFRRPEADGYASSVSGTLSIPIDRELAARVFVNPFYQNTQFDVLPDTDQGGIALGGDIFLRYPKRFEVSIGPRYAWRDLGDGFPARTLHALGADASGRLFLEGLGFGPIDLEVDLSFEDGDVSRAGAGSGGRRYGADAGVVIYFADRFSLSAGGGWSRRNFSRGANTIRSVGRASADFLIPGSPSVTLSVAGLGGKQEEEIQFFPDADRTFYQIGFSVTLSFPGADSLVELERYFY